MISIVKVTSTIFRRYLDGIMGIEEVSFPSPWTPEAFWEEVRNPIAHFWLSREGDEVAGYICFWMYADEIHLMNIAVHPLRRGEGIGTYLIRQMMDFGIAHCVERIWLEVRPSNLVAQRLYRKLGFKEVGRRKKYYTDTNEDALVMSVLLHSYDQKGYHYPASFQYRQRRAV